MALGSGFIGETIPAITTYKGIRTETAMVCVDNHRRTIAVELTDNLLRLIKSKADVARLLFIEKDQPVIDEDAFVKLTDATNNIIVCDDKYYSLVGKDAANFTYATTEDGTTYQITVDRAEPHTLTFKEFSSGEAENGLPVGGNTGDILVKASNTDYDTKWVPGDSYVNYEGLGNYLTENNYIQNDPSNPVVTVNSLKHIEQLKVYVTDDDVLVMPGYTDED